MQKLEEFLFDIMGLTLPGVIFGFSMFSLYFLNVPIADYRSVMTSFLEMGKEYSVLGVPSLVTYSLIVLFSYIIGHLIKVIGKYIYDFGPFIFDKVLLKPIVISKSALLTWLKSNVNTKNYFVKILRYNTELLVKSFTMLEEVFGFSTISYSCDFDRMRLETIRLLNEEHNIDIHTYDTKWYPYYKSALTIAEKSKVKTHARFFLAKYNFYRSLAFVFLVHLTSIITLKFILEVGSLNYIWKSAILIDIVFWITFHTKYKRYWTACGNEAIVGLFHSLISIKINDDND